VLIKYIIQFTLGNIYFRMALTKHHFRLLRERVKWLMSWLPKLQDSEMESKGSMENTLKLSSSQT